MGATGKHAAPFVAVNLDTVGGISSEALAVSANGLVVGRVTVPGDAASHAFVWSEDTMMMTDLGRLGGGTQSWASAVSDDGVIVGVDVPAGGVAFHTFVRTPANGNVVDLGTLGGSETQPTAMNSKGAVVGVSTLPGDKVFHAFLWTERGGMVDLDTVPPPPDAARTPTSIAYAINDDGVVVGESATGRDGVPHAFEWTQETGMIDLGTLGGLNSFAQAVNGKGVVAGNSDVNPDVNGDFHAFIWTRQHGMTDIGVPGMVSRAENINGHFVIGQTFQRGDFAHAHGFAWTRGTGLVDVGMLDDDRGSFATAVNDRGVVVGNSFNEAGLSRAFAWSLSSRMVVPLETPDGGSSGATAINGDLIVGFSCTAGNSGCHATLWKPSPRPRRH
jgi:probable HAF family extracellular repeat protein